MELINTDVTRPYLGCNHVYKPRPTVAIAFASGKLVAPTGRLFSRRLIPSSRTAANIKIMSRHGKKQG